MINKSFNVDLCLIGFDFNLFKYYARILDYVIFNTNWRRRNKYRWKKYRLQC